MAAGLLPATAAGTPGAAEERAGLNLHGGAHPGEGDPLLGIGNQHPVHERVSLIPNLEYVFVDRGDLFTASFDGRYELTHAGANPMWVGGGMGIMHRDTGPGSDRDPAVNLLWGMDLPTGESWNPFVSTKAILSDSSKFAVNFDVRFGGVAKGHPLQSDVNEGN